MDNDGHLIGLSFAQDLTDEWFAPFERAIAAPAPVVRDTHAGLSRHVATGDLAVAEALDEAGLTMPARNASGLVAVTAVGASLELETARRRGEVPGASLLCFDRLTSWFAPVTAWPSTAGRQRSPPAAPPGSIPSAPPTTRSSPAGSVGSSS